MYHLHMQELMSGSWYMIVYGLANLFLIPYWSCTNYLTRHSQVFHSPLYDRLQYVIKTEQWENLIRRLYPSECTTAVWDPHLCKDLKDVYRHGYRNRGALGACAPQVSVCATPTLMSCTTN